VLYSPVDETNQETTMSGDSMSGGSPSLPAFDVEEAVRDRYSSASRSTQPSLCCPVTYDPRVLAAIPAELIERDYGCGDPSRYVAEGETVLDLGSGGGKACYLAAQIVGPRGRVIGVDMNDDMLALARRHRADIAKRLGYANVAFHKGRIQDLALDLERFHAYLAENPASGADGWMRAQAHADAMRRREPMIADHSIDVVISNCVLNLVRPDDRRPLFAELFRVLKPGGRAVISDIVSDEPVPERLRQDPELWSGCISGAFVESAFLESFAAAGFHGIEIVERPVEPWATLEGIEFRSVTVRAYKPAGRPSLDAGHAVIYRGPWAAVEDDEGNTLRRGVPTAASERMFEAYTSPPYAGHVIAVPPRQAQAPVPFDGRGGTLRDPRETKGAAFRLTSLPTSGCCGPGEKC
jgi:arsenite methyltransferase